jgi:hypothetical protein
MTGELPPGFTVLCVEQEYGHVQNVARAVGPAGQVVACSQRRFDRSSYADAWPIHLCVCVCRLDALPFLSHAMDAVIGYATAARTPGFVAEVRRVLAPGGLFIGYTDHTQAQMLAECRERSVEAGLELVDEAAFARRLGASGRIVTARAPLGRRPSP